MAMTVTATASAGCTLLAVQVVTSTPGTTPGIGAIVTPNPSGDPIDATITPQGTGSRIFGVEYYDTTHNGSFPVSPISAATTLIANSAANGSVPSGDTGIAIRSTNLTVAGTPVDLGTHSGGFGDNSAALALMEVTGSAVTIDASTPNAVPHPDSQSGYVVASPLVTDSFSPPAGLLVALFAVSVSAATVAVSDSAGLSWTQRASQTGTSLGNVSIWSAPVPGITVVAGLAHAVASALAPASPSGSGIATSSIAGPIPHSVITKFNSWTGTDPTANIGEPGNLGLDIGKPGGAA